MIDNQCEKCGERIAESGNTCKDCKGEMVEHPEHYNMGNIEVIDVIEDWDLNFNQGNIIKYVGRCEYKGNKIEDLEKARFYIDREIDRAIKEVKEKDLGNATNWNG